MGDNAVMRSGEEFPVVAGDRTEPRSEGASLRPVEVLVVLPALDEAEHIEACVRSLMTPREWMSQTTVVVADGGSCDATRQIVGRLAEEYPNLSLIDNAGRLQSAGVNAAVDAAASDRHRVLIRCDVHAVYPPGYVRDIADAVHQRGVASVVTSMDAVGRSPVQRATAWVVGTPLGSGGAAHRGGTHSGFVDHGHHAGFDLEWFRSIGGYDATFSHNEDAEFDARLARAGGSIWLEARVRLEYLVRPTLRSLWRQYWNYGRGRARTVAKHRMVPRVRQMVPVINVVLLAISVVLGLAWAPGFVWCAIYAGLLLVASALCAIRLRSAAGLLAGPALGAMHIAWGLGFLRQIVAEPLSSARHPRSRSPLRGRSPAEVPSL